jgi:hypothetical protein
VDDDEIADHLRTYVPEFIQQHFPQLMERA